MSKQDRQGVRTPADVERKYNLGQFGAVRGMTEKQGMALNRLNQTVNQYMTETNVAIEELKERELTFCTNLDIDKLFK